MSKTKTRVERFDEAFRTLLIILTISFSGSLAFYKEVMEPRFFSYSAGAFVTAIVIWTVATLLGGYYEYFLKISGWWFLMAAFGVLFARMYFTMFLLPPLVVSVIVLASLVLTLPILSYLKEAIGEELYKYSLKIWSMVTLLFIILDVLYYIGLFTPTG